MSTAHLPPKTRMNDEQRQIWKSTGAFPIEHWTSGPDQTPLLCPMPTNAELRELAVSVPKHIQSSGWYIGKPAFGQVYLYGDNFAGMGRQWLANFPAGKRYFGTLSEYMAAVHPRTVLRLLDRIDELQAMPRCSTLEPLTDAEIAQAFDAAKTELCLHSSPDQLVAFRRILVTAIEKALSRPHCIDKFLPDQNQEKQS